MKIWIEREKKEGKQTKSRQTNKQKNPLQRGNYRNSRGKNSSNGKEGVPKFFTGAHEPELGGAKINISEEERAGYSACCGAGDLDVGAEERFQGTEGHCAWNAKASAALRREMPGSRRSSLRAASGAPGGGAGIGGGKMGFTADTPLPAPRLQSQRARSRKDLETEGLKQGLREKSANFRRLIEALLQARKAALGYGLKFQ